MAKELVCSEETLKKDLSRKIYIVTGTTSGIGLATVKQLAKQSATVICASRNIELAKKLNDLDVLVGTGDFYAVRLLEALNIDTVEGVMRISFVHYTSKNDIDKLVKALDSVI